MRVTGSAFFVRHSIHFYTLIFIHSIHLQKYPCVPSGNSFVCTFKNLVLLLYLIQNPLLSSMAGKQYHLSFAVIEPFQCLFQSLIIIHHKRIVQYDRHGPYGIWARRTTGAAWSHPGRTSHRPPYAVQSRSAPSCRGSPVPGRAAFSAY